MTAPVRIQRKRTKGWKMPENTVSVSRPGKWGNPFYLINEEGFPWISDARDPSVPVCNHDAFLLVGSTASGENLTWRDARKGVVALFRQQCCDRSFAELRGKNLACWCPLDEPCHAPRTVGRFDAMATNFLPGLLSASSARIEPATFISCWTLKP